MATRGAGTVDRDDRLVVEVLLRVDRHVTAGKVRVAAGGERDDEGDRLRRIALRAGRDAGQDEQN
jgi:hypothetical protein